MPPRTIDNLGVDVSTRYAEDQKILDQSLIKEAQAIPTQAEIDVSSPHFPAELTDLLQLQPRGVTWASFDPPLRYFEQRKRLFTHQMIPAMGSEDKQASQAQKIQSMAEEKAQKAGAEDTRQQEEKEKQGKILISLLKTINLLDKLIIDINSKRNQYQKG